MPGRSPAAGRRPRPAGRRPPPRRFTAPATGVVIAASIFIASIVATVCAGRDLVVLGRHQRDDARRTAPRRGPVSVGSAFSAAATSTVTDRSRTWIGRSWPLSVHITVRRPRSSTSPTASSADDQPHAAVELDDVLRPRLQPVEVVAGVEHGHVAELLAGRRPAPWRGRGTAAGSACSRRSAGQALRGRRPTARRRGPAPCGRRAPACGTARATRRAGRRARRRGSRRPSPGRRTAPGARRTRPGRRRRRPGAAPGRRPPSTTASPSPAGRGSGRRPRTSPRSARTSRPGPSAIACWRRFDSWPPGISWS